MMRRSTFILTILAISIASALPLGLLGTLQNLPETSAGQSRPSERPKHRHAYHDRPPTEPLPATLSREQFAEDKATFVAYAIAANIRELLYQTPCYCPCDREESHTSLLDCFASHHGIGCPTCQKEVIFVYEQSRAGKGMQQIREAIARGDAWKVDIDGYATAHYSEYK